VPVLERSKASHHAQNGVQPLANGRGRALDAQRFGSTSSPNLHIAIAAAAQRAKTCHDPLFCDRARMTIDCDFSL